MGYGINLLVWGDYACFTRPEMKTERVSYDVITPSAARGILEAIHWKPAIRWIIDRIHVINEIKFDSVRRNEVEGVISPGSVRQAMAGKEVDLHQYASSTKERQQRASLILRDVCYLVQAHFELTLKAGEDDNEAKHYNMAIRRMKSGQYFHHPYMGCREFPAHFRLIEDDNFPKSFYQGEYDLGWMLWDLDFEIGMEPKFFRPAMIDGVIEVPDLLKEVERPDIEESE